MSSSGPWWTHWVLDLPSIAMLGGIMALYLRGANVRAQRSGRRHQRRTMAFLVGIVVVLLGQVSPVASWSELLLWPHMVQHLMITVIAAPLLAAGAPVSTARQALSPGPRRALVAVSRTTRRARRAIGDPPRLVVATVTHVALLWLWHTPPLYDAAVANAGLHLIEHATFLGSAVWFWSEVWSTARRSRRAQGLATLCLGVMIVQGGLLGALLTFAGRSLYEVYTGAGGFTALSDQQLAGGLMWVPPGFIYASVAVRRFVGWMREAEADLRRRELRARAAVTRPAGDPAQDSRAAVTRPAGDPAHEARPAAHTDRTPIGGSRG